MKNRWLVFTLTAVLLLSFGILKNPKINTQAAPGAGPGPYLPFIVGGIPQSTPNAPSGSIFGIEVDDLSNPLYLSDTQNANPTWIRQGGLFWDVAQPTKNGTIDWSSVRNVESGMIKASQLGYRLIQVVQNAPWWALNDPNSICGPLKQSEFASFGEFLKAAIERYSAPPYNVQYWEIGNEPDSPITGNSTFGCWGDPSQPYFGGQYYGSMLAAVIPYIKQANPNVKILNGGLLLDCDPSLSTCNRRDMANFLEGIVTSGVVSQLDYVNFHSYDYQGSNLGHFGSPGWGASYQNDPALVAKVAFVRSVLKKYGLDSMPIIETEVGLIKTNGGCDAVCMQNKALYVGRAYPAAIAQGLVASIWFQASNTWANSGLYGGPMYDAFVFARNELDAARFTRKITEYDSSANVAGYEFDRGDIKVWVLWSHDLSNHIITLPGTPRAVYQWSMNNSLYTSADTSTSTNVGIFPVYLEWSK